MRSGCSAFIAIVLFCACSSRPSDADTANAEKDNTAQAVVDPAQVGHTDVRALLAVIDSIYEMETHWFGTKNKRLTEPDPFCLLMFDHNGVRNYRVIPDFEFMEYRSKEAADTAFTAVEELIETGIMPNSFDDVEMNRSDRARRTFNKGGSTYLLLGNVILHHARTCDFSEQDKVKENELINTLFGRYGGVRMMQGFCNWGEVKRRP